MQTDPTRLDADRRQLNAYRLLRDLTYPQLAEEMRSRDIPIRDRTLYDFLTVDRVPIDRTIAKVRRFLELIRQRRTTLKDLEVTKRLMEDDQRRPLA